MADSADKKTKAKPKVMDVGRPKKTAAGMPQVVIPSRSMINRDISASTPMDEIPSTDTADEQATPQLTSPKRTVITPLSPAETTGRGNAPEPAKAAGEKADEKPLPKEEMPTGSVGSALKTPEETPPESESAEEPAKTEAEKAEAEADVDTAASAEAGTDSTQNEAKQSSVETRKAVEAAERAAKRKEELEKYITSKEFFVPINAVARKRSIKVSALMTVLVFLLALVLIDLMIDSGVILLVQKIPHTHFFTSN